MGEHWCPQISQCEVDGKTNDVRKQISIMAGKIGDHQCSVFVSVFDPSEISALAVQAYDDVCKDLEKNHGESIPRMGLRVDDT